MQGLFYNCMAKLPRSFCSSAVGVQQGTALATFQSLEFPSGSASSQPSLVGLSDLCHPSGLSALLRAAACTRQQGTQELSTNYWSLSAFPKSFVFFIPHVGRDAVWNLQTQQILQWFLLECDSTHGSGNWLQITDIWCVLNSQEFVGSARDILFLEQGIILLKGDRSILQLQKNKIKKPQTKPKPNIPTWYMSLLHCWYVLVTKSSKDHYQHLLPPCKHDSILCQCLSSYHELYSYSIWIRIFSLFSFDINALAELSK